MFQVIGLCIMFYGGKLIVEAPELKGSGFYVLAGAILIVLGWWLFGVGGGMSSSAGGPAYG